MADVDWDPFGAPTEEVLLAPKEDPAMAAEADGDQHGGAGLVKRLRKEDIEYLADGVLRRLREEEPWNVTPKGKTDMKYGTHTCTLDDWRHVDVKIEVGRGILYVILNRPNENNSMQDSLNHGFSDAVMALHSRKDLRVVVITGEGRMFCAGGDPKAWQAQAAAALSGDYTGDGTVGHRIPRVPDDPEVSHHLGEVGQRALKAGAFPDGNVDISRLIASKSMNAIATVPQLSICLVNGSAMGGGVGWVCSCDYVIALRRAYLVLSEVKIGVIPATISPYVIAKIGVSNGKRFFCAADNILATRAMEYGMVNEVVENMKEGHEQVRKLCKLISKCGPRAVEACKRLSLTCAGMPLGETLQHYTIRVQAEACLGEEGQRGYAAFEKDEEVDWGEIGFDVWPTVGETIPGGKKKKKSQSLE